MVARKPVRKSSTTKKPATRKTVPKKVVKATPPKSEPGSRGSHTARLRAAGQELGLIEKHQPKIIEKPTTLSAMAKQVGIAEGVTVGKTVHVINVPWDERAIALSLGAKWNTLIRQFIYTGDLVPLKLQQYLTEDFSLGRWIEDEINRKIKTPQAHPKKMVPRKHQAEAITKIVRCARKGWRGFIEADSTGLGKSLSSLIGISEVARLKGYTPQRKGKLLIICPRAVIPHWRNTIVASGVKNLRIMVVNYDQAQKLLTIPTAAATAKKQRTKNKVVANSGKSLISWDYVIADESHKLKNFQIAQTPKIFSQIAQYAADSSQAPFIVWASATIGQNPLELAYLAPIIGQKVNKKLSLKNWGKFLEEQNYHVEQGKVGYSWVKITNKDSAEKIAEKKQQQSEDIQRLAKILFDPEFPSIRRTPENISGWPKTLRIPTPIELTRNQKLLYDEAWTEFRSYVRLHPHGKDPAGGLAAQLRFRQKASFLRAPDTAEFALELLDNKLQVAIYVEFIESLDQIKNILGSKYPIAEFSGRNSNDREKERLRFQQGEAKVILFTAIEGVSFHAEEELPNGTKATKNDRALIIHDQKYSAIQATQIEGRTSRDGKSANTFYMFADATIEAKITETMIGRMANMRTLSGDDYDLVQEITNLL